MIKAIQVIRALATCILIPLRPRLLTPTVMFLSMISGVSAENSEHSTYSKSSPREHTASVYISSGCLCCDLTIQHLESAGYRITRMAGGLSEMRRNVPAKLKRCVAATIDGYAIEGKVPIHSIEKFLHAPEKPFGIRTIGLSVTTESNAANESVVSQAQFNVVAFTRKGHSSIIDRYRRDSTD